MSYVQSSLSSNESVKYLAKISVWSLLPWILFGILMIYPIGLGLILFAVAAIKYFTTEMAITNKRVIAKTGLFSRKTIELNLLKIESIQVDQSVLGRIFNYGSIVVAGAGNPQAPVRGISSPMAFRKAFIDAQESAANAHAAGQPAPVAA